MSNTALLPLPLQAKRYGARVIELLCNLGFEKINQDGTVFRPRFASIELYGDQYISYEIDTIRLRHTSTDDLASAKVVNHLSDGLRKRVTVMRNGGFYYVVHLRPPERKMALPLPSKAMLDLSARPKGDLLVPIGIGHDYTPTSSGISHAGIAVWRDLPQLGHVLLTGTTGSGKSTWLHAALAGLLTGAGPDILRVVLIDGKRSELGIWTVSSNMIGSLAYTEGQAAVALGDVVNEINSRGDLFAEAGVRDLSGYNRCMPKPLPSILVVMDEALDLILDAGPRSELVQHVKTIAMRGRSGGIYLWLCTQHATAVSGLPRPAIVNLTTRLVFRVVDLAAAQAAGCPGAELISRDIPGRMLAKLDDAPVEIQGYWIDDADLSKAATTVAPARPLITDDERALVLYALDKLGGEFIKNRLTEAFAGTEWTEYKIKQLAAEWEGKGWLTSPKHRADPRRVTLELAKMVCEGQGQALPLQDS